ncbi:MAG: hypothetical protein Q8906_06065 [Bacillota bacterium]|nr:hypothetical protein [Bacillota bacterium]
MILNSDVTASQKLGVANNVTPLDKVMNLKDRALEWKPSKQTYVLMIGACAVLIIERKIRYKPKTFKLNMGGKKK